MDILIEAPGHENLDSLEKHFNKLLLKKFEKYEFIKKAKLKVSDEPQKKKKISLLLQVKNDQSLFSSDINSKENLAFNEVVRKINVQIEKYKQVHYHTRET